MTDIDYKKLAETLLESRTKEYKAEKGFPSTYAPPGLMAHGRGGLFSTPGLERPIFSAMQLPSAGLQSRLPLRPAVSENPLYGIFTGVTASSATGSNEPVNVCDDPPVAGLSKLMSHTFAWGRFSRMTQVYDITRFGRRTNRAEFADFQFYGTPAGAGDFFTPTTGEGAGNINAANSDLRKLLFELAVAWQRDFARKLYTGNPTNNTAGGGHKEFYGLDYLINTGYRDAETGIVAPAADSLLRDFGSVDISVAANGATLVREITAIWRSLKFIASRVGLDPVNWGVVMPYAMFYEISAIWPCAYQTSRCSISSGTTVNVDRNYLTQMTDNMRGDMYNRSGQYLLIDGEQVPVILDDGITETQSAGGSFTSQIYFVPLTVLGGQPVTWMEYLPFDQAGGAMDAARALAPDGMFWTTDNGRFIWHKKPAANFCVQMLAATEPRLLLLTPHLAARLQNVKYTPLVNMRSWDTANTSFYVNGGRTSAGSVPSLMTPHA